MHAVSAAFQMLAAVLTMLFVVYRAPETRLVFATFFVARMFGMLRSSAREPAGLPDIAAQPCGLARPTSNGARGYGI
jgi:hypothetical protein